MERFKLKFLLTYIAQTITQIMLQKARFAIHPEDFKTKSTEQLRTDFLINELFQDNEVNMVYTHYDRMIVGGAMPLTKPLTLGCIDDLKAEYFLQRRELGIINVGQAGQVFVDGNEYTLKFKEALYIGKGVKEVIFMPSEGALFYFNSAPAHCSYPTKKISYEEAEKVELGSIDNSNHRTIRKLIVNSVLETCQLQMGLTELKPGSVWNTMPAHIHNRRMEVYFYFEIQPNQQVCHFMGPPNETRNLWVKNNEAVLSPPWSIHSGVGTSNYSFIWGMAGENLDYGDMDGITITDLK
jgi:4-deoxy-L-threo-5-hexosulose-uronate ketol-isomerase